jgi:hypothetical protein
MPVYRWISKCKSTSQHHPIPERYLDRCSQALGSSSLLIAGSRLCTLAHLDCRVDQYRRDIRHDSRHCTCDRLWLRQTQSLRSVIGARGTGGHSHLAIIGQPTSRSSRSNCTRQGISIVHRSAVPCLAKDQRARDATKQSCNGSDAVEGNGHR